MNPVELRPCTRADCPAVRRLLITTWISAYAEFVPEADLRSYFEAAYSEENLGRMLTAPDQWIMLALDQAEVVGVLRTFVSTEQRYHVASLYVAPGRQRGGVGGRLMHWAEQRARQLGHHQIWLGVMTRNRVALAWYQRLGFVFDREEPFTMGRTSVPHLIGHRALAPRPGAPRTLPTRQA